jgi:cytochrome c oxidase subunit 2
MSKRVRDAILAGCVGAGGILAAGSAARAGVGQPSEWQLGLQAAATHVADRIHAFHDLVNWIIIAIALFVLILLVIVLVRFNERANPTPSKTTHNSMLEFAWTVIPIFILIAIALPSFKLLFLQYTYPPPDLVIKATGNQWNWTHSYPDHTMTDGKPVTFTSIMLKDDEREALIKKGIPAPRLLAVDNEVVVPVNKNVHVLVTASDVIHNWTIPSFGSKVDAVPGRTTATWFNARREGVYYGQCSELCGKDHAFMPIAVRVVQQSVFDEWIGALKARDRRKAREIIERVAIEQARKVAAGEANPVVAAVPAR